MTEVTPIRRAVVQDAAELARLLSPLGYPFSADQVRSSWETWSTDGNFALVVPASNGLLGAVTLHHMMVLPHIQRVGRITALAVDPTVRGRGWGRTLMAAAENALRELGCGRLEVTSHARRAKAHSFYRHIGYEQTSFRFMKLLAVNETEIAAEEP